MPKSNVHRAYQGESAQARIDGRRRRLLDVAFGEMATAGAFRVASIGSLCRAAELNKRYFYESFADLDELAGAVLDDLAQALIAVGQAAAADAMAAGMSTPELARYVLGAVVDWLSADPRRARVLFAQGADHPRAIAHRAAVVDALGAALTAFSLVYHEAPGPLPIAHIGSSMLVGGTIEVLLAWLDGRLAVPRDDLVADLASLWVAVGDGAIAQSRARLQATRQVLE